MTNIILAIVGTLMALYCLYLTITDKNKYQTIIADVDANEYFLKDLYYIGFKIFGYRLIDLNSKYFQNKTRQFAEVVGLKQAKKIVLYDVVAEITYVVLLVPFGFLFAVIMDEPAMILIAIVLAAVLVAYYEYDKTNKIKSRHDTIQREFPHVLSQLALLVNAGMPLREAIAVSAQKGTGILYTEMQVLVDDMNNGIPDYESFARFSERCGVDSVKKFSSLIIQNVKKGSAELAYSLRELSSEVWNTRVSSVKEEGEKASTKLLIPIMMIFLGILVMVAVPMFIGLDFG